MAATKSNPPQPDETDTGSPSASFSRNHPLLWAFRGALVLEMSWVAWPIIADMRPAPDLCRESPDGAMLMMWPSAIYLLLFLSSFIKGQSKGLRLTLDAALVWPVLLGLLAAQIAVGGEGKTLWTLGLLIAQAVIATTAWFCYPLAQTQTSLQKFTMAAVVLSLFLAEL